MRLSNEWMYSVTARMRYFMFVIERPRSVGDPSSSPLSLFFGGTGVRIGWMRTSWEATVFSRSIMDSSRPFNAELIDPSFLSPFSSDGAEAPADAIPFMVLLFYFLRPTFQFVLTYSDGQPEYCHSPPFFHNLKILKFFFILPNRIG